MVYVYFVVSDAYNIILFIMIKFREIGHI